jgi:PST family polysaccharide transporter
MTLGSLPARVLSGSFWSVLGELSAGGARAFSYFIYARFLSPTDFGLVGFCLLLISLFPLLIDNSLGLALIRQERDDQRTFSVIFFLNVGLSTIAVALLWACAPWASELLNDPRVRVILPVLSVQLLCNALCGAHIAIARRRFRYRSLVPMRLVSTFCSLAVGLPLAFLGYSYWALVAGSLTAAFSQMIAAWVLLRWRPSFVFDWDIAKSLSGFTSWVAVDMGVTWMMMSGGGVILAYFLGAHDLGLFRLSDQIDTYLMGAILSPLIPVFYSAFCEAAADREQWQKLFARTVRTVALVAMTLAAVIVLLAHPLEAIIGIKWRGIGAIVVLNAIADGFSYATLPIPTLLRAQGRSRAVAGMRIAMVAGQVVVYSFAAPHGLQAFVSGKVVLEIAMYAISYGVLRATFNVPVLQMVGSQIGPTLAAAVSAVAGLWASSKVASLGVPTAAVGLAVFGILMAAYLFLAQRRFLVAVVSNLTTRASVAAVDDLKR